MIKITGAEVGVKAAKNIAVTRTPSPAGRRLPGLDGLRAIAVIGVLLYHAGVGWLPGGFLGVDLFFVISGFLITSLLLSEARLAGHLSLRQFYLRRARRLLPALVVLLAVVAVFMAIFAAADFGQARGDIAAALGYVSNWWYVLHHRSYFIAAGRPSPFQHLWSLAVEEQFYLIWPAVLVALVATRARLRWITAVALAGAIGSALWMRVLAVRGNVPFDTDSSRLYFGTDTHASALLLGAAAAAVLTGLAARLERGVAFGVRAACDVVGVVALVAVCWSMHAVDYFRPGLYRGGFLAFAAVGVVVVATASAPGGWLGRALDVAPMRWIGERSYGLYLWHWPVFVYTRPGLDWSLHGPAALAVRLAIVGLLTEVSYRLVEVPLRREGVVAVACSAFSMWRVVAPVLSAVLGVAGVAAATTFVSSRVAHTQARARSRCCDARPGSVVADFRNGRTGEIDVDVADAIVSDVVGDHRVELGRRDTAVVHRTAGRIGGHASAGTPDPPRHRPACHGNHTAGDPGRRPAVGQCGWRLRHARRRDSFEVGVSRHRGLRRRRLAGEGSVRRAHHLANGWRTWAATW